MAKLISQQNPLGIDCIDHLEFTCDNLGSTEMRELFHTMGFSKTYQNEAGTRELYSQGQVRFYLVGDKEASSHARQYFEKHGEGVSKISFLVEDAEHALNEASNRGAEIVQNLQCEETEHGVFRWGMIQGFGDVLNEFVERPRSFFRPGLQKLESDSQARPLSSRVARIDHLTNNVPHGEKKKWVDFYKNIYGFEVSRYFDIKGKKTGLESEVVQMPSGAVIIPINESDAENSKSQIQEFLDRHNGAGVQHIALSCAEIISTVTDLRERGMQFLDIPHTYYQDIPNRGLNIEENIDTLEKTQLLVDGNEEGYLIQNFTDTYVGPLFFEFIQRKNNNGFGEGNFQALFDAIERDQEKRGHL